MPLLLHLYNLSSSTGKKLSIVFLLNLFYRSLCFSYHTIMSEYSELIPTYKSIKESARQLGLEFDVE